MPHHSDAAAPPRRMRIEDVFARDMHVTTGRLRLRRLRDGDAAAIFDYARDPRVSAHLAWDPHECEADARDFIADVTRRYEHGRVAPWGIEQLAGGRLIGTAGFTWWEPEHARAEIAYVLHPDCWGRGYATELVEALIAFGFEQMHLHRMIAHTHDDNAGSRRVLAKCGMVLEGVLREAIFLKGRYRNLCVHGMLRQEWPPAPGGGAHDAGSRADAAKAHHR